MFSQIKPNQLERRVMNLFDHREHELCKLADEKVQIQETKLRFFFLFLFFLSLGWNAVRSYEVWRLSLLDLE